MAEAVIVEAVRSPMGKRNGGLSSVHPGELSAQVLNGLAERAGIDPEIVDDVIWGRVMQAGEQALDIGRTAVASTAPPSTSSHSARTRRLRPHRIPVRSATGSWPSRTRTATRCSRMRASAAARRSRRWPSSSRRSRRTA
jgi:Thiolase, N-terminal domain